MNGKVMPFANLALMSSAVQDCVAGEEMRTRLLAKLNQELGLAVKQAALEEMLSLEHPSVKEIREQRLAIALTEAEHAAMVMAVREWMFKPERSR